MKRVPHFIVGIALPLLLLPLLVLLLRSSTGVPDCGPQNSPEAVYQEYAARSNDGRLSESFACFNSVYKRDIIMGLVFNSLMMVNVKPETRPKIMGIMSKQLTERPPASFTVDTLLAEITDLPAFYQELTSAMREAAGVPHRKMKSEITLVQITDTIARAETHSDESGGQEPISFVKEGNKWFIGSTNAQDWTAAMKVLEQANAQIFQGSTAQQRPGVTR